MWVDDISGAGGRGDRPSQFFLLQDNDQNHQLPRSFLILDALQVL